MNSITLVGNAASDVETKDVNGKTVAEFRIAVNEQYVDATGERKDGFTSFLRITVWGRQARHVAESIEKGDRVIVTGRIKVDGNFTDLIADTVGLALTFNSAKAAVDIQPSEGAA